MVAVPSRSRAAAVYRADVAPPHPAINGMVKPCVAPLYSVLLEGAQTGGPVKQRPQVRGFGDRSRSEPIQSAKALRA